MTTHSPSKSKTGSQGKDFELRPSKYTAQQPPTGDGDKLTTAGNPPAQGTPGTDPPHLTDNKTISKFEM